MSEPRICAAPDCTNTVPPRVGRGRPFIYCTPACRQGTPARHRVIVEVEHEPTGPDERPVGRVWSVLLRRGTQGVVIARELGRPSAEQLAAEITSVLERRPANQGAAID